MTKDMGSFLFQVFLGLVGLGILFQIDAIRRHGLKFIYSDNDDNDRRGQPEPPSPAPTGRTLRVEQRDVPEMRRRASDRIDPKFTVAPELRKITRDEEAKRRWDAGLMPATFHYTDPPAWMLEHPMFEAIWDEIKTWDVNVPTEYMGYMGATGNHAAAILLAIMDRFDLDSFDWKQHSKAANQ